MPDYSPIHFRLYIAFHLYLSIEKRKSRTLGASVSKDDNRLSCGVTQLQSPEKYKQNERCSEGSRAFA